MQKRIVGFEPVCRADARVLILGSMPSVQSLEQSFYYAHPRNVFWPMLAEILKEAPPKTVPEKKEMLLRHQIALWDSVHSCEREGSLDSDIRCAQPNDFESLYRRCPQIRSVLFNGAAAQKLYPRPAGEDAQIIFYRLPSTSPAYTLKYELKLAAWRQAIKEALEI